MQTVQRGIDGLTVDRLERPVRRLLGFPHAAVTDWSAHKLSGGYATPPGDILRVDGAASTDGCARQWSLVLKVLRTDNTTDSSWPRERLLVESGLLDNLPEGFRTARCHDIDEGNDGSVWLWFEALEETCGRWSLDRFAVAARHLGRFNGRYLAAGVLPDRPWFNNGWLRGWTQHFARPEALAAVQDIDCWKHPLVLGNLPVGERPRVLRWFETLESMHAVLESLPPTLCHHDAFKGNLFAYDLDGRTETFAVDWQMVGHGRVGEDAGQLTWGSLVTRHADPEDWPALHQAVVKGYIDGLQDAGYPADPNQGWAARCTRSSGGVDSCPAWC